MARIVDLVLPLVASPALVLFLKVIPFFDLQPMAGWTFSPDAPKFIVAVVAALFAYQRLSVRRRLRRTGIGLAVFLACLFTYDHLADTPPTTAMQTTSHALAFATFFGYYFAAGYCTAHVAKVFTQPSTPANAKGRKKPKPKT